MSVVLEKRLRALKKRAIGGDVAAAGQAQLLEQHLTLRAGGMAKREDDRVKVLVGAAVLFSLQRGHSVDLKDLNSLLALMSAFLTRPQEIIAVLGENGLGSAAFHRCTM